MASVARTAPFGASEAARRPPAETAVRQAIRALVIEDSAAVREQIADILTFEGFEVRQAANGRRGLEMIRQAVPDLILCDLMMPELDGYETLAQVRRDAATALVPFVCLSARAERIDLRRAMELGASDYLTKPFTAAELLGAIDAVMTKRGLAVQSCEAGVRDLRERLTLTLPHELHTPLQCITGYAEMLTDPEVGADPAEVAEFAQRIRLAGLRLRRFAESFVLYGRLSAGGPDDLALAPPDTPTAVHEVSAAAACRLAAEHLRAADLVLDCAPVWTRLSEGYLSALVVALVDNALKFSTLGSRVHVATGAREGCAFLRVTDRGRGMQAEQIAAIDAFVQFERRVYEQQGLGLGLVLAQRLAALLDGRLDIDSRPGHGTMVTVVLPRCAAPAAPRPGGSEQGGAG